MMSHVATAVDHEVSQGSYMARSSELVTWWLNNVVLPAAQV